MLRTYPDLWAPRRYQLGAEITKGLGAGARPNIGREAAYEDKEALAEMVRDCDMVLLLLEWVEVLVQVLHLY